MCIAAPQISSIVTHAARIEDTMHRLDPLLQPPPANVHKNATTAMGVLRGRIVVVEEGDLVPLGPVGI